MVLYFFVSLRCYTVIYKSAIPSSDPRGVHEHVDDRKLFFRVDIKFDVEQRVSNGMICLYYMMIMYSGWLMSSLCGILLQLDTNQHFKPLGRKFVTPLWTQPCTGKLYGNMWVDVLAEGEYRRQGSNSVLVLSGRCSHVLHFWGLLKFSKFLQKGQHGPCVHVLCCDFITK